MGMKKTDSVEYSSMPFKYKLARFSLLLRKAYPFLGELCMRVTKYRKDDLLSPAATDGYNLYFDEERLGKLPEESLNFVLLHELFHIILRHRYPKDMPSRDQLYWNIAFDLIANWLIMSMQWTLKRNELPIIPVSGMCLSTDDLSHDPAHVIASSFIRQVEHQGVLSINPPPIIHIVWKSFEVDILDIGSFTCDLLTEYESGNPHVDADVRELLSSCRKSAGLYGLPSYIKDLMENLRLGRKLPWRLLFKRYLEAMTKDDFDFLPPDKRMLYSGMILPGSDESIEALNNALIVLDVSSSVQKDELLAQIWQISSVLSELRFTGSIIAFASGIHQKAALTDKRSLKKFIGGLQAGGGTNWADVVEYVRRLVQTPKPIVVFTDGYFFNFTEGLSNIIFITQEKPPRELYKLGKVVQVKNS